MSGFGRTPAMVLATALALAACDGQGERASAVRVGDDGLALSVPPVLATRAVNEANLVPRVQVNGVRQNIDRTGDFWTSSLTVPEGEPASIVVSWFERIGFQQLNLAEFRRPIASVDRDRSIRVFAEDYETDRFDEDDDGRSNLAERIANTNPFDDADPGPNFASVLLPFVDPGEAPAIDGDYDGVWDRAQFRDRDRLRLDIDNLMIDQGAVRLSGATEYRWAGLHDGEYLYLLILGEEGNGQTPFGDSSPDIWNDDAVELFIDGDNSKLQDYDGVDDRQVIIPLTRFEEFVPNRSADPEGRFLLGFRSADLEPSAFDFATCLCDGAQHLYEVRLRLVDVGIEVDRPFGFEVQLDDDRDGELREAKWGWFHPARTDNDVDNTKDSPLFMSTVRLLPSGG